MFADPAVVTINAVPYNLVRINQDRYSSEYLLRSSTAEFKLSLRNTSYTDKKRGKTIDRHNAEIVNTIFPVAPATVSTVRKAYVVIENERGDNLDDPKHVAQGLLAFLTNANIAKLMNFES